MPSDPDTGERDKELELEERTEQVYFLIQVNKLLHDEIVRLRKLLTP